jgi:hypothetical protein
VATSASGKGGKLLVNGVELEVAGWETVSSTMGDGDGVCTGLDGVTAMIDAKRLVEIEKRRGEARYGYATVGNREYAADVGELLGELQALRAQNEALHGEVERLRGLRAEVKNLEVQGGGEERADLQAGPNVAAGLVSAPTTSPQKDPG